MNLEPDELFAIVGKLYVETCVLRAGNEAVAKVLVEKQQRINELEALAKESEEDIPRDPEEDEADFVVSPD